MGLGLKDSPPGFDLTAAASGAEDDGDTGDAGFVETEQY
jgi:DNA-directed RNA polymerase subunit alpha